MHHDALGDRMKSYEAIETERRFDPDLPIYARIDGRAFSTLTRGLKRPYDPVLSRAMIETAKHLVAQTHARIAYTQSDEISIAWLPDSQQSEILFNGRIHKFLSVLPSMVGSSFQHALMTSDSAELRARAKRIPAFDCRVTQLPDRDEVANMFLWRQKDAVRNAVSMAARAAFSPKALHGKSVPEMKAMLAAKGIEFDDYPAFFRRGTFLRRITVERRLTDEEWERIPEHVRPDPETLVQRTQIAEFDLNLTDRVANRPEILFDGAEPVISEAAA